MTTPIRAAALPLSRWVNGAGRKADIATGEGWSVGYAWLDADAPFSHLPGRDRTITLVEGPGFTLDLAGQPMTVRRPFAPSRFDGGVQTQCRIAGPCRVLNAITDRDRLRHEVSILERSGPVEPGDALAGFLVALDGPARLGPLVLGWLDAARVDAPAQLDLGPGSRAAWVRVWHAR